MEWIEIFAPATIANLGPGFDVLGMAVRGWGDTVVARKIDSGIVISHIEPDLDLTSDPDENTAGIAAREVLTLLKDPGGLEFHIKKGLPLGSGLGSSAASAAAGAFAANFLYGNTLTKEELILPATKAEEKVSGFHADNTAPSLLGGAVLIRSTRPLDVSHIGTIENLKIILVTPDVVILTRHAREILPHDVPLELFVRNAANAAAVTAAFARNDYELLVRGLKDLVVEPVRCQLIRGFDDVKAKAFAAGADAVCISGSGPTLFAVTNQSGKRPEKIRQAMARAFGKIDIRSKSIVTEMDLEGTRLI
ncbi:MAG: homoserine kinase [Candidatus Neomarinimicrobiota bacterium]